MRRPVVDDPEHAARLAVRRLRHDLGCYYENIATPFDWRFTKDDLAALMKLDSNVTALPVAA